jgi:HD-like signal output (HDOD) protein
LPTRRRDITAPQLEALYEHLDRLLDRVGLETMPRVAARLLELSTNPDAQIRDYAEAVKTDWALTGRILRLANSAFYAQRQPVTRLDRALVLLGIDRTKAVCLGFYLSRAAGSASSRTISRRVWGQSVYRANLCSALARVQCPHLAAEAFIVGLMLDCGQPLMVRLLGETYEQTLSANPSPVKLHAAEFDALPYTHVDVVTTLVKRWKFPALLARPIAWHHTLPPTGKTADPIVLLQRLAYYVGAIQLDDASNQPQTRAPLTSIADRLFEIGAGELEGVVKSANREYSQTAAIFDDVGDAMGDVENVADMVQNQLVQIMDEQLERTVKAESRGGPERLRICGTDIEVEPARNGEVIAYISSAEGERLVSCTVNPNTETPESVGRLLGLEDAPPGDLFELLRVMHGMAA